MPATLSQLASAALLFIVGGCASSSHATEASRVPVGTWGGEHVRLTVTADGAHLDFDCASGEIARPLVLDAGGDLSIEGVLIRMRGGPIRVGQEPDRMPARYSGHLEGDTFSLTVVLVDSGESAGSFSVKYGAAPKLTSCR